MIVQSIQVTHASTLINNTVDECMSSTFDSPIFVLVTDLADVGFLLPGRGSGGERIAQVVFVAPTGRMEDRSKMRCNYQIYFTAPNIANTFEMVDVTRDERYKHRFIFTCGENLPFLEFVDLCAQSK